MKNYEKELLPLLGEVEKPARYTGGEFNTPDMNKPDAFNFCICFPDVYEIGMSNLGISILYQILNSMPDMVCERCFAPWTDMERKLRENNLPLFSVERKIALKDFDAVGFSVQYEMLYSNILYMLDLAKIPFYAKDRGEEYPILIAGGPCTVNPEPFKKFFDIVEVGEGEYMLPELLEEIKRGKERGLSKAEILENCKKIEGIYVPSLHVKGEKVKKAMVRDFENAPDATRPLVPNIEIVHDRACLELYLGCGSGCRFCQAGFYNRGIRERSVSKLLKTATETIENTGFDEMSLSSLSTGDYSHIKELVEKLKIVADEKRIKLSLPSLRLSSFDGALAMNSRKSSLTFAPEAGSERLRDVINKNVTEEEILSALKEAFADGYTSVKLYFMLGLPTETDDDIRGIGVLVEKIRRTYFEIAHNKKLNVSVSCSVFIPKPVTPFQWCAQISMEEMERKQQLLRDTFKGMKGVSLSWHDATTSAVEGIFARGDERLNEVIEEAYLSGAKFDGWSECFSFDVWINALKKKGFTIGDFNKEFKENDELPWDVIDPCVDKSYLWREHEKGMRAERTRNCREGCNLCGIQKTTKCTICGGRK